MEQRRDGHVACCGGGMIGSSFAVRFAWKGWPCVVFEIDRDSAERTRGRIGHLFGTLTELGVMGEEAARAAQERIQVTWEAKQAFEQAWFVQECGPEDYGVKREMLACIEEHAAPEAVIASSTSGLLVTEIARDAVRPERCLGAHPYNPPHLIPLLELTRGARTTRETIDQAVDFYRGVGQEPIVLQKEKLGFAANRIAHALYREVVSLVTEGVCTVEEADKAVCFGPGLRWAVYGPNLIYELGGGPGGIGAAIDKFRTMSNLIFADLSNSPQLPEDWRDTAVSGMEEELKHLPKHVGATREEWEAFRDRALVELLRLHHKL